MPTGASADQNIPDESPHPARISVVRDQHLVPLLQSAATPLPSLQPWNGVLLEYHLVRPGEIPQHEHPELCLHLQLSGDQPFEWWSNGHNAVEPTRPGSLILIPPGTSDRLRWSAPSERLILSIKPDILTTLARDLGAARAPEFRQNWSFHSSALQHLLTEMDREARVGWPLGSLYAGLLATGLETQLLKSHAADPPRTPPLQGGLSLQLLKRAMEYINANLHQDIRLDEVAQVLSLSPSHFAHQFRNTTGRTPYQYLLDQRIARALQLLQETKLSIQYISAVTGFGSPVNFIRSFRQRIGVTPQRWRNSR